MQSQVRNNTFMMSLLYNQFDVQWNKRIVMIAVNANVTVAQLFLSSNCSTYVLCWTENDVLYALDFARHEHWDSSSFINSDPEFFFEFCWYMENNIIECWRTEIVFLLQLMNILGRWGKFLESLMNSLVLLECFSVVRMRFLYENVVILKECVNCVFERIFGSIFIKKTNIQSVYRISQPNTPWKRTDWKISTPFRRAYIKRNSSSSWKLKQIE